MTFNVGDRIEYFRGNSLANERFFGLTGTIVGKMSYGMVAIRWDHYCLENMYADTRCVWSVHNIKPLMNDYDPTQVGDTEDDI